MSLPRRIYVLMLDFFVVIISYEIALLLHDDFSFDRVISPDTLQILPVIVIVKLLVFGTSNMYRSIWKYASLHDLVEIFKTVSIASVLAVLALAFFRQMEHFSRVVFLLDWGILLALVAFSRVIWRLYRERSYLHYGFNAATDAIKDESVRTLIIMAVKHVNLSASHNL